MSLADEQFKKNSRTFYNTPIKTLENIIEISVPSEEESICKWFYAVIENRLDKIIDTSVYFDCWIDKIQILLNTDLLTNIKDQTYNLAQKHKKLDAEIVNLYKISAVNLEKIETYLK